MRKRLCFVLALLFLFPLHCNAAQIPEISAKSAVLMVADTGEVVFEKNAHEKRSMASTTKIMTALLTLECASPQSIVIATAEMVNIEGTSMGLHAGDKVSYNDLVYGMLLASGNDAANTAAFSIDGSIEAFASRMNKKAAQLGMKNTVFVTPSGLDDENHYSTAYDMALLGCYALKNPEFIEVCSSDSAKLCYGKEPYSRYLNNHNKLLKSFDGAIGIKTGFTKKSGRCLVSAAERNGVTLVCVTLNAPDDWNDHKKLLTYGFEQVTVKNIECKLPELSVVDGNNLKVKLGLAQEIKIPVLSDSDVVSVRFKIKPFELAPIKKGQILGEAHVLLNGKTVKAIPIMAEESVYQITEAVEDDSSFFDSVKRFFSEFSHKLKEIFKERQTVF